MNTKNFIWVLPPESTTPKKLDINVLAEDGEYAEVTGELTQETEIIIGSRSSKSQ